MTPPRKHKSKKGKAGKKGKVKKPKYIDPLYAKNPDLGDILGDIVARTLAPRS